MTDEVAKQIIDAQIHDHHENIELCLCGKCGNNGDEYYVEKLHYIDEVDLDKHPSYRFTHNEYYVIFNFAKPYEKKDTCYDNTFSYRRSLWKMINTVRVIPPCDKDHYNIDDYILSKTSEEPLLDIYFDYVSLPSKIRRAIKNDKMTDELREESNILLLQSYDEDANRYNIFLKLEHDIENIYENIFEECYNTITIHGAKYLFIYIEKECDAWYIEDCTLHQLNFKCDDEVRYGYELCDIFTLPHILEHDGIEYVRIDVQHIHTRYVFTRGKILCGINYIQV